MHDSTFLFVFLRSSTMSLKSLKLPMSILKCRQSAPACSNEKVIYFLLLLFYLTILFISQFAHFVVQYYPLRVLTFWFSFVSLLCKVVSVFIFFPSFRMPPFHALKRPSSMATVIRHSAEAQKTRLILSVLLSWLLHHSEDQGSKTPPKESEWKSMNPSTKQILSVSKSQTVSPEQGQIN